MKKKKMMFNIFSKKNTRIQVNPAVLIPRAGSETVVRTAHSLVTWLVEQKILPPGGRVLDLGTGSGCLLLALLTRLGPMWSGAGIDISQEALDVAHANAVSLGLGARCTFTVGSFAHPGLHQATASKGDHDQGQGQGQGQDQEREGDDARYALIVCNPPYLRPIELLHMGARSTFEPRISLVHGEDEGDGLGAYREVAASVVSLLGQGGLVVVEVPSARSSSVKRKKSSAAGSEWDPVERVRDIFKERGFYDVVDSAAHREHGEAIVDLYRSHSKDANGHRRALAFRKIITNK